MRLTQWPLMLIIGILLLSSTLAAQNGTSPQQGDPPVAALISVSQPDEGGLVTITGAAGAVFPAAQIAVRNLFTHETVYTGAGITGAFSVRIRGVGNTPFWISPTSSLPTQLRDQPVSLPGGPGTIVYSPARIIPAAALPTTIVIVDGQNDDWEPYPDSVVSDEVWTFRNTNSIYVFSTVPLMEDAELAITFGVGSRVYELALNPDLPQTGLLREILPTERDPITISVAVASSDERDQVELRIAVEDIGSLDQDISIEQVTTRLDEQVQEGVVISALIPSVEEQDSFVYPNKLLGDSPVTFGMAGPLAEGSSQWQARGRVNTLRLEGGDQFIIELDTRLQLPDLAESLAGLELIAEIGLQPVYTESGSITASYSNNGWANVQTPSGLAVDNLVGDIELGAVRIPAPQVIRKGDTLLAAFQFELTIPEEVPAGLYVPTFQGYGQIADGDPFRWEEESLFGTGPGLGRDVLNRLPLAINVGNLEEIHLPWVLFYDDPSDGSRGILPDELDEIALSNRVRFNSTVYTLPPGEYPLEPYLLSMLPNAYDVSTAPMLPLLLPGGRASATITRPDGMVDVLPDTPFSQNQLSTVLIDERERFGEQNPLDTYRLVAADPEYGAYNFDAYGEYELRLSGTVEDIFGNRYTGGGTYRVLIAEPLDFTPGVLPGTPFDDEDTLYVGGHVKPGVPAEVDVTVRSYNVVTGDVTESQFDALQANEHGYFFVPEGLTLSGPAEYTIDYFAHYDDGEQLWAASLRSAGVVGAPEPVLLAHGRRGIDAYTAAVPDSYQPAWFTTAVYPPEDLVQVDPLLNYPYFQGDMAIITDDASGQLRPVLQVQDVTYAYRDWLLGTFPDYVASNGVMLGELVRIDALPVVPILAGVDLVYEIALRPEFIVSDAYAYISAVRPDVTVRQFVMGSDSEGLTLHLDANDPLNQQIGAGIEGLRAGDYVFLFGGVVVRNGDIGLRTASPYAALMFVGDVETEAQIMPPLQPTLGDVSIGPLRDPDTEIIRPFFHPTSARPGQVFTQGETLVIAGQAAPTTETSVQVEITAPDGTTVQFSELTNGSGYFYAPEEVITLDQTGVWQMDIQVTPIGNVSAGAVLDLPVDSVIPGLESSSFSIFVVPEGAIPLSTTPNSGLRTEVRPGVPMNMSFAIPAGWTNTQGRIVIATESYVLDSATLSQAGGSYSYQFSPAGLGVVNPSYEFEGRGDDLSASDVVTVTAAITGLDDTGNPAIRTRTLTIFHDEMISFEALRVE